MSIEAQIQANTTALLKLCAILEARADGKDAAAKPAATHTAIPPKPAATHAAKPAAPVAPKGAVTYDDIKKAANALIVKHGREAFMKVLEGFQLPNAMAAKPEGYPMLLDAINKAAA